MLNIYVSPKIYVKNFISKLPPMNIPLKKSTATENNTSHTISFQIKTFLPSRGPNGNKLNVASRRFTKQINPTSVPQNSMFTKKK